MYHFSVQGIECRCDTVDELREALGMTKPSPVQSARANPTKSKAKAKRKAKKRANVPDAVKNLPYIEEGLNWDVVKKIAKQLNRKDIKQLRCDLKTRKDMGK